MIAFASMERKGKLLHKQGNLRAWHCNESVKQYKAENIAMRAGDTSIALFILSVYHSRDPRFTRDTMSSGNKNFSR